MKKIIIYFSCICLSAILAACGAQPTAKVAEEPSPAEAKLQAPDIKVGDTWVFELKRLYASTPHVSWSEKVISLDGNRIVCMQTDLSNKTTAKIIYGPGWTPLSRQVSSAAASNHVPKGKIPLSFPLWIGKRWKDSYSDMLNDNPPLILFRNQYTVVKKEALRLPAGEFDTWRIQISQNWVERFYSEQWHQWYSPVAKRIVKTSAPGHFTMQMLKFIPAK
jgi:hypothetical protein